MGEKLEVSKEFIEEFALLRNEFKAPFKAMREINEFWEDYPNLDGFLFGHNNPDNQLTFAKIWAGEIELVEKKSKYVIYQIDDECHPWLLGIGVYGTLKNLPDFNANQPCEHGDYANKNCHFDQKFAFAMRDTGKFKIEKVVK